MSGNTSSAEPQTLLNYCSVLAPLDQHVVLSSQSLAGDLASFESSCTEYPVHVGYLADTMASHGRRACSIDEGVKAVGEDFIWADGGAPAEAPGERLPTPDEINKWSEDFLQWAEGISLLSSAVLLAGFVRITTSGNYGLSGPGLLKWLSHLDPNATYTKPGTFAKGAGRAAWILAALLVLQDWALDIRDYRAGLRDGSELISAMAVDAAIGFAPLLATAAVVALLSNPVGWVAIGIGVGGIALGVGLNWWMGKDGGVNREKAIDWVDRRISDPWTYVTGAAAIGGPLGIAAASGLKYLYGENGAEHRQQAAASIQRSAAWVDDNVLQPVGNAINGAGERARGWIDNAAANLINRRAAVGVAV